jgi:hypothetical protein
VNFGFLSSEIIGVFVTDICTAVYILDMQRPDLLLKVMECPFPEKEYLDLLDPYTLGMSSSRAAHCSRLLTYCFLEDLGYAGDILIHVEKRSFEGEAGQIGSDW